MVVKAVTGVLYSEVMEAKGKDWSIKVGARDSLTPPDWAEKTYAGDVHPVIGHTMVGYLRLKNIKDALRRVVALRVPGDFAELGTWRGGACIFARLLMDTLSQQERQVHVFDAFEDGKKLGYSGLRSYIHVNEDDVRRSFKNYDAHRNVHFYKGYFSETVPSFAQTLHKRGGRLAVLRIDGNFYASYQDSLYSLFPLVPVDGVIIFDDVFDHPEVMRCWKHFKADHRLTETVEPIDGRAGYLIKRRDTYIDPSKKRKPPRR
jgi:hypothetical protein